MQTEGSNVETAQFQVRKDDFKNNRVVLASTEASTLQEGEILVEIERFAFTANNITYAATGDRLGYWQFFPPAASDGDDGSGWGVIPVWGFARVVKSKVEELPVGERFYGYFPPATQLRMQPVGIKAAHFIDGSPHRSELPAGYNMVQRVTAEPGYEPSQDDFRMLLFPLFLTSFFIWDQLQGEDWYGAEQVIVVSASSKTSIGLGYALAGDESAPPAVGITSARSVNRVEELGIYDGVVAYDDLSSLDNSKPTAIVDMSGNSGVLAALHQSLGDNMKKTINVGLTHWDEAGPASGIITDRSEFFFAPSRIQTRIKEWGPQGYAEKTQAFLSATTAQCQRWLKVRTLDGLGGLEERFDDVCDGNVSPDEGLVVVL